MKWTERQKQAIEEKGKSLLVSAAAGSGKTAVLIERIKRLIIEENVNVDEMLVVTFTKAAASEMKEKLISAIYDEIEKEPSSIPRMRQQLERMYRANIQTFHSFAYDIVREYFYLIDIDPKVKICDDTAAVIMQNEAIDQVFDDMYDAADERFFDFLTCYGSEKDDENIKKDLLKIYEKLMSMPDPFGWLDAQLSSLEEAGADPENCVLVSAVMDEARRSVERAAGYLDRARELLEDHGLEKLLGKFDTEVQGAKSLLSTESFEEMAEGLSDFEKIGLRLTAGKDEKEEYALIKDSVAKLRKMAKDELSKLKEDFFFIPISSHGEDMKATAAYGREMERILIAFDQAYSERKAEKDQVDFSDVEHYCIRVLKDENAAGECRKKFKYIFIDEYQDSNYLQEEIIGSIRREDNVFMVGDLKQSIYSFRQAEPDIFREKYERYRKGEGGSKIDLNMNFRSKPKIIDAVNGIFEPVMEGYDDDAALHCGLSQENDPGWQPELVVIDEKETENDIPEEIAELKSKELEAMEAAEKIKEYLGKEIYDSKLSKPRKIRKKDIVILMRGARNSAQVFCDVMRENGIDAVVSDNSGYFDTPEISQFLDFLKIIDNGRNDISLLSVMRSCAFDFSTDDIIRIRLHEKEGSFRDALEKYAEDGSDRELAYRVSGLMEKISEWRLQVHAMRLDDFVWKLMRETGFYLFMGTLAGGRQKQANLRTLVDQTAKFCDEDTGTLFRLLRYIDSMQERKIDIGQAQTSGENEDVVRIMTIHKSKGLEFPVTIVSGLGRRFNFREPSSLAVMHRDLGIGMTRVNTKEHWKRRTLAENLIRRKTKEEELEEEIRILYVAMTRAKDVLIMTGTQKNAWKKIDEYDNGVSSKGCYLDIVYPNAAAAGFRISVINREDIASDVKNREDHRKKVIRKLFSSGEADLSDLAAEKAAMEKQLSFRYPFEGERHLQSKYSATQLNSGTGSRLPSLAVPSFKTGEHRFTAAEKGTFMHSCMEHLDFARAAGKEGEKYINERISQLVDEQILLPSEAETIDESKLMSFFRSDIGKRAAASKVRKETPFNMVMELEGNQILVQGIIDCWFMDEKGLVLIDYKTNRVLEDIKERYREQIDIYKRALREAVGHGVDEAYLYLFETGDFVEM